MHKFGVVRAIDLWELGAYWGPKTGQKDYAYWITNNSTIHCPIYRFLISQVARRPSVKSLSLVWAIGCKTYLINCLRHFANFPDFYNGEKVWHLASIFDASRLSPLSRRHFEKNRHISDIWNVISADDWLTSSPSLLHLVHPTLKWANRGCWKTGRKSLLSHQ